MVTDLRYGTLALAASRAGVSMQSLSLSLGVSPKTIYAWSERGIPRSRWDQVSDLVERLRAFAVQELDFRHECQAAGISQVSVSRLLGVGRQQERWGAIGVPHHMRSKTRSAIALLSELNRCRSEMAYSGYVPVGKGIEV